MNYFNFNGKILPGDSLIVGPGNRALRYGDGLFETMKFKNNRLILWEEHMERLWHGMKALEFELPKLFTKEYILEQVLQLIQKNKHTTARVRLAIIRGDGGLYDATNQHPNFIIESWALDNDQGTFNTNGMQLCIYRDALKICDRFSQVKHNNYLPYLMGALFAKKQQCNDAIILNQHLRTCDSSIANIFIVKGQTICTPPLSEGCINGIMRQYLLKQLPLLGFQVTEQEIPEEMLMDAGEIFLTNSIYNIRWVAAVDDKKFQPGFTKQIIAALRTTNDGVFC